MTPIDAKAARITLILFDVDGVLTDGTVVVHSDGSESKNFAIRDGIAMVWAAKAGLKVGFLSARTSATTLHRAAQLGVSIVVQGVSNKLESYQRILADERLTDEDVAYMGDDIVDLGVLGSAGFSTAPADAVAEVRGSVDWVSAYDGGAGAARELIELILRAQNKWDQVLARYVGERDRLSGAGTPTP